LGEGLTVIATANDGVIEAFQMKSHKFLYGIQWHPEMMTARGNEEMKRIFETFVKNCEIE
ncbi:MAG: gamma-glutamyl-gamma-aminobutyrate hydrolase family protein, partial [Fusobacterium sp.]|nr:gamma-glutamyl-gamma-aminobutyrate hydrolase family protein [Fusobacterium sp.]